MNWDQKSVQNAMHLKEVRITQMKK